MLSRAEPEYARTGACPSNLELDRLATGELSSRAQVALQEHLQSCEKCETRRERWSQLAASYLARPEAQATLQGLLTRSESLAPRPSPRRRHAAAWLAGVCVAAAILVGVFPRGVTDTVRSKGGVDFGFFVKRGAQVFGGTDGEHVWPGDQLRFTVRSHEPTDLAIFSLDANGKVSLYYPVLGAPARLPGSLTAVPLAASVELDDTLGDELLVARFCRAPQALDSLQRELAATGTLPEQAGCQLRKLRVHKERPPQ